MDVRAVRAGAPVTEDRRSGLRGAVSAVAASGGASIASWRGRGGGQTFCKKAEASPTTAASPRARTSDAAAALAAASAAAALLGGLRESPWREGRSASFAITALSHKLARCCGLRGDKDGLRQLYGGWLLYP